MPSRFDKDLAEYFEDLVDAVPVPPMPAAAPGTLAAVSPAATRRVFGRGGAGLRLAGAAAAVALCFVLPRPVGINPAGVGLARLVQDDAVRAALSGSIRMLAKLTGDAITKE